MAKLDLPKTTFHKTGHPGVLFTLSASRSADGERVRTYYVRYRDPSGKARFEKVKGRNLTPAKVSNIRADRVRGKELPNRDREAAEEAARIAEEDARKADAERPTIARLWDLYDAARHDRKDRASDTSRYNNYLKIAFGNLTPDEIDPLSLDRWRVGLAKEMSHRGKDKDGNYNPDSTRPLLSKGTQSRIIELLRRLIRFGIDHDLIDPPRLKFKLPKLDNERTERLTESQTIALLKALREETEDPDAADATLLAWSTGMRKGEVLSLSWSNVDVENGWIRVVNRKGGKSLTIPISKPARELLTRRLVSRKGGEEGKANWVFPADSESGHRMDIAKFQRRLRTELKLSREFRMAHGLRHDFASRLAENGEDILLIAQLLGHTTIAMSKRYAHLSNDRLKNAAEAATAVAIGE